MNNVSEYGPSHLEHISAQISRVLDPLAVRCRGWPAHAIGPLVDRAWRLEFGSELSEAALADTAVALRDGRPWCEALWSTGW